MDEEFILKIVPFLTSLRIYHKHDVHGLERLPEAGPVIIASNHSLATYDMLLLMQAVYQDCGRFPRSLVDRLFYRIPHIGSLMERLGCVVGSSDNARALLNNGATVYIAPGGMQESLRPSKDRYQIRWSNRKGFARLAIETGTPVVLAACPKADDIFEIYDNRLTKWVYRRFKVPLFFAHGVGPTPLPKPVKLRHFLSKPIYPPEKEPRKDLLRNKLRGSTTSWSIICKKICIAPSATRRLLCSEMPPSDETPRPRYHAGRTVYAALKPPLKFHCWSRPR